MTIENCASGFFSPNETLTVSRSSPQYCSGQRGSPYRSSSQIYLTNITNPNSTTVTNVYDDDSQLTSVTNKNNTPTTLSSFTYVLDNDGRRSTCTKLSGDVIIYGYTEAASLPARAELEPMPILPAHVGLPLI